MFLDNIDQLLSAGREPTSFRKYLTAGTFSINEHHFNLYNLTLLLLSIHRFNQRSTATLVTCKLREYNRRFNLIL